MGLVKLRFAGLDRNGETNIEMTERLMYVYETHVGRYHQITSEENSVTRQEEEIYIKTRG